MMRKLLFVSTVVLFLQPLSAQFVTLNSKNGTAAHTPIEIMIKQPDKKNTYGLYNSNTKKTYPIQWYDRGHALFILDDEVSPGASLGLEIRKITATGTPFKTIRNNNGIEMSVNDKPVFFYHTAIADPPADSPSYYKRSGFIHPLYSPGGTIMTDDFPSNHAHQHAVFHAWTNNTFQKQQVDFWNQHQLTGTIQHKEVLSTTDGPVFSELKTTQEYVSLKAGIVLTETWTIRVYPFSDRFMFDLHVDQTNITKDTLYLNKYIYGGMAFRGSREWDPFNKKNYKNPWNILTSDGFKDSLGNNTSARWVTAYGMINGSMSAATVFNYSSNIRYPQKIRVHPNMPYWVYAPVIDGDMYIAPGGKYSAVYRYYVSNEIPDNTLLERIHENWIVPPMYIKK